MFLFRADAGSAIGFGHVARCLTLADAARSAGHDAVLATTSPSDAIVRMAGSRGVTIARVDASSGSAEDAAATRALAGDAAHLVVDGYGFDAKYLSDVRSDRARVTYVDDLGNGRFSCDAVLNHNLYASRVAYDAAPGTLLLLGPTFALVRDAFVHARHHRSGVAPAIAKRILVTMGGSDPTGETVKVVDALIAQRDISFDVRVVIGAASRHADAVMRAAEAPSSHSIEVLRGVDDLGPAMAWCDLAITASGVTVSELACAGVPALYVVVADNQRQVAEEAERLGLGRSLGWHADVRSEAVTAAVRDLAANGPARSAMANAGRNAIDGRGKERVIARLLELDAGTGGAHTSRHEQGVAS